MRFAQLGFDVGVNYSRSDVEAHETIGMVEEAGARALLLQCDVADNAAVGEMIATIEQDSSCRIFSAVLPMIKPGMPVRATVPITRTRLPTFLVYAGIADAGSPFNCTIS